MVFEHFFLCMIHLNKNPWFKRLLIAFLLVINIAEHKGYTHSHKGWIKTFLPFEALKVSYRKANIVKMWTYSELKSHAGKSWHGLKSTAYAERQTGTCCSLISVTTKSLVFHLALPTLSLCVSSFLMVAPHPVLESVRKEKETTCNNTMSWNTKFKKSSLLMSNRILILLCHRLQSYRAFQDMHVSQVLQRIWPLARGVLIGFEL